MERKSLVSFLAMDALITWMKMLVLANTLHSSSRRNWAVLYLAIKRFTFHLIYQTFLFSRMKFLLQASESVVNRREIFLAAVLRSWKCQVFPFLHYTKEKRRSQGHSSIIMCSTVFCLLIKNHYRTWRLYNHYVRHPRHTYVRSQTIKLYVRMELMWRTEI